MIPSILNGPLPDRGKHSAKTLLHLAKALPSVTLGKACDGKTDFAECFFSRTRQRFCREPNRDFAKCLTVRYSAKLCRVPGFWHLAKFECLPSAQFLTLGKEGFLEALYGHRVPCVCRVLRRRHSANVLFVECPCSGTRRITWHSAKKRFPVVVIGTPEEHHYRPWHSCSSTGAQWMLLFKIAEST